MQTNTTAYQADIISSFIQAQLASAGGRRPLMVSMQGPQGVGKSTLSRALVSLLASRGIKCTVSSLDDFYFPYKGLLEVAQQEPENRMLQGRGLPGTHDIDLLEKVLSALWRPTEPELDVSLPIFDKSQHSGYGDRSPETVTIREIPDVFVLEGWSLGFRPLASDALAARWRNAKHASRHSLPSVAAINRNLELFADRIYGYFDAHISLSPISYDYIYTWRTQQEHSLKATNGGQGMADEEIITFVDRYMPVYELFGDTTDQQPYLSIKIGADRSVLSVK